MSKNKTALGVVLTLLGGICWGFSGSCGQYIFTNCGATSNWLVPIRMVCTGVILLSFCFIKDGKKTFGVWTDKSNILRMIMFAVFGLMLCQFTYFKTIELSNAGIATVLQYLAPAMILVYICLKERKKPAVFQIAALLLAIGGTVLIVIGTDVSSFSLSGEAFVYGILSAVFLACYSLIPIPLMKKQGTPAILGWGMLMGGIMLMPVFRPWKIMPTVNTSLILAVASIIIFGTVIAYTFYLEGVNLIGASSASLVSSIEPVAATVISAFWLGTKFSVTDIIGIVMILLTVVIIALAKEDK